MVDNPLILVTGAAGSVGGWDAVWWTTCGDGT